MWLASSSDVSPIKYGISDCGWQDCAGGEGLGSRAAEGHDSERTAGADNEAS